MNQESNSSCDRSIHPHKPIDAVVDPALIRLAPLCSALRRRSHLRSRRLRRRRCFRFAVSPSPLILLCGFALLSVLPPIVSISRIVYSGFFSAHSVYLLSSRHLPPHRCCSDRFSLLTIAALSCSSFPPSFVVLLLLRSPFLQSISLT